MSEQEAETQHEAEIAEQMKPDSDAPEPETSDEPEPEAAAEPEPEPEPSSDLQMEKVGKQLDALTKSVATRISTILGDAALEWEECEICNYWNTPGWRHKGPLPEEVENVVRLALGMHGQAEYRPDEYSRECDKCNGLGVVLTGAKVVGQETIQCLSCKGMGWIAIGPERATGAFITVNGPAANAAALPAPAAPPVEETPEIAAARALLQGSGHMVIAPFVGAT